VGTLSPSLQFTVKEWGYLVAHVKWPEPDLQRFVGICVLESQLISGRYRPESENPLGGRDMGASMINDKAWPSPDPFVRFDPITNVREAYAIYMKAGLKPWGYPTKRNDAIVHLDEITAAIGDDPYDIHSSPYWRMKGALINTWDLPIPPAWDYVPVLPPAPLRYNTGGAPPNPTGININSLQRILQQMGRFPGNLDYWYGPRVRDGLASVQRDLTAALLWTGLTDGKIFSIELAQVWEGVLESQFLFARGTL
jgi:hypothetical protein